MQLGLHEVDERKIYSIRISDNLMFGTQLLIVGMREVVDIKHHEPLGDGDKHFADVTFENGVTTRCFDVINIQFYAKER